jgi:sugar O-acyltransferase (sialic acid O-acetyltransferase NeuD family)
MGKTKKLVIFGTGEIAELADYYFSQDSDYEVVAFTADDEFVTESSFRDRPLIKLSKLKDQFPAMDYEAHVALSYNKLNRIRKEKYLLMKEMGYTLASYICTKSVFWPDLNIGDNCLILENQTIQPTVTIGNNVMIWSGNHLGHGCTIKDHAYISSHVCISGHTVIGEACFIGVNSTFKDFITIGSEVFVTMGAGVTKDIKDGAVVIASQSTIFDLETDLAKKLRSRYFNLED